MSQESLGQRILIPRTLWDRGLRYGMFSWAALGVIGLVYVLWRYALMPVRIVFAPVAVSLVIVYLLNPIVGRLETHMRRGFAVTIVYLAFVVVAGVALAFLIPAIVHQVRGFFDKLPDYLDQGVRWINDFSARRKSNFRLKVTTQDMVDWVKNNRSTMTSFLGGVRSVATSAVHVLITVVLGIVLSAYVLLDLPKIRQRIVAAIPERNRGEALTLGESIGHALGGFFRGQLLIATFVGVFSGIGLAIFRVPFAVLGGLILGIFQMIPLVGIFLGSIPVTLIGLLSGDPWRALYAVIVIVVVQQIDNHFFTPNILRRTVQLHPITVMLSLLVGGALAGIFGMVLVIPAVAAAKSAGSILLARDSVRDALSLGDTPVDGGGAVEVT